MYKRNAYKTFRYRVTISIVISKCAGGLAVVCMVLRNIKITNVLGGKGFTSGNILIL